jgi:hypothetical protein
MNVDEKKREHKPRTPYTDTSSLNPRRQYEYHNAHGSDGDDSHNNGTGDGVTVVIAGMMVGPHLPLCTVPSVCPPPVCRVPTTSYPPLCTVPTTRRLLLCTVHTGDQHPIMPPVPIHYMHYVYMPTPRYMPCIT